MEAFLGGLIGWTILGAWFGTSVVLAAWSVRALLRGQRELPRRLMAAPLLVVALGANPIVNIPLSHWAQHEPADSIRQSMGGSIAELRAAFGEPDRVVATEHGTELRYSLAPWYALFRHEAVIHPGPGESVLVVCIDD